MTRRTRRSHETFLYKTYFVRLGVLRAFVVDAFYDRKRARTMMAARYFRLAGAAFVPLLAVSLAGQSRPPVAPPDGTASAETVGAVVAIRGATILTVTHGTIQNGTIVLR